MSLIVPAAIARLGEKLNPARKRSTQRVAKFWANPAPIVKIAPKGVLAR